MSDDRVDNFRLLYDVVLPTNQADFGRALGLSQPDISGYNTRKKPISDYLSRRIEKEFGLPKGWMDRPNARLMLTADEYDLLMKVRERKGNAAAVLVKMLDGLNND